MYMEKKQIRLHIGIQKRYTKKVNKPKEVNNAQLDPKSIPRDRQKRYTRRMYREQLRRAYVSGWKQAIQHGQDLKKNKQEEVGEILQSKRDRA